ncbi:pectin methyl esterase [Mycena floridula]|nr:pectin methyl esterase [Mycena floridula]
MLYFLALLLIVPTLVLGDSRTSPPAGAKIVRPSPGSGEFGTISAAVASLTGTASASIFIYPGTYTEQVSITRKNLTIYGYTTNTGNYKGNQVTITGSLNAQDNGGNDACATLRAEVDFFNLYNVNIKNTYGVGKQATAVAARGNIQGFYGCSFTGYQDTLLADGGFQYFSNCYIEGAVDYIYGGSSAWFGECTIASNGGGAITANSGETTTDPKYYVFDHSSIVQAADATSDLTSKVYLGRPWREFARVVYQNCALPALINPIGWTTLASPAEPVFMEFNNTGAGASISKRVTETPLTAAISKTTVLGPAWETWTDTSF